MHTIRNRRDLIQALSIAAELEHGLCCQYLFAAFSMKTLIEDGLTAAQRKLVQDWKNQLLTVSRQEMDHMGQVFNLVTAIGGAPHFGRPNFPEAANHYGRLPEFFLSPFSLKTMERFAAFELPEQIHLRKEMQTAAKQAKVYEPAMEEVLHRICIDAHWDYGEVWDFKEGSPRCLYVCFVNRYGERTRRASFHQQTKADLKTIHESPSFAEAARESKTPVLTSRADNKYGFFKEKRKEGSEGDFNTGAAIPLLADGAVQAVFVFSFETFDPDYRQDNPVVDMISAALNVQQHGEPTLWSVVNKLPPSKIKPMKNLSVLTKLEYSTIGGFYRLIRKGFYRLHATGAFRGQLFYGGVEQTSNDDLQIRVPHWFNMDFAEVKDIDSATKSIDQIVIEGEGSTPGSDTAGEPVVENHFERFSKILSELKGLDFEPARKVATNPYADVQDHGRPSTSSLISHEDSRAVAEVFDSAYETMLFMMMRYFSNVDEDRDQSFSELVAIFLPMMSMVIRPLGEMLTMLPLRNKGEKRAGPSFDLHRDVKLLSHFDSSWTFYCERLDEMSHDCHQISKVHKVKNVDENIWKGIRERLQTVGDNLGRLSKNLEDVVIKREKAELQGQTTANKRTS